MCPRYHLMEILLKVEKFELRKESSSEKDLNALEGWKKDKRYHVSEMPFDENIAENISVFDL